VLYRVSIELFWANFWEKYAPLKKGPIFRPHICGVSRSPVKYWILVVACESAIFTCRAVVRMLLGRPHSSWFESPYRRRIIYFIVSFTFVIIWISASYLEHIPMIPMKCRPPYLSHIWSIGPYLYLLQHSTCNTKSFSTLFHWISDLLTTLRIYLL
jgi:hypothetical protein